MQPLILTLALDDKSQALFDDLRQQYFPPERNHLKAHLSLFHQLPAQEEKIIKTITDACNRHQKIELQVSEVRNIGSGVAYKIESDRLLQLHKHLQQQWQEWLIPQDQHKLWPHITIQNKVEPAMAAQLREELAAKFEPFIAYGTGLSLWEYLGGPWRHINTYEFKG
ncbi:2'-5' RNA ligase family protein [Mucilaginibacter koreensis]